MIYSQNCNLISIAEWIKAIIVIQFLFWYNPIKFVNRCNWFPYLFFGVHPSIHYPNSISVIWKCQKVLRQSLMLTQIPLSRLYTYFDCQKIGTILNTFLYQLNEFRFILRVWLKTSETKNIEHFYKSWLNVTQKPDSYKSIAF